MNGLVLVMSSVLDVAVVAVFVPATVVTWVLHAGSPYRLRLTAVGVVVVLVPVVQLTARAVLGSPLPVWFLLLYAVMVVAMGCLAAANVVVLQRERRRLLQIQQHL